MKVQGDMKMSLSEALDELLKLKYDAQLLDRNEHYTKIVLAINTVTEFVNDSVSLFMKMGRDN